MTQQPPTQLGRANPIDNVDGLPDNALPGGKGPITAEVEWLTAAEPGETEMVPYSRECDINGCNDETVMIVKSVHKRTYQGQPPDVETCWVSVCKPHSKAQMDYAYNTLGRVYAVIIHADAMTPEVTEG